MTTSLLDGDVRRLFVFFTTANPIGFWSVMKPAVSALAVQLDELCTVEYYTGGGSASGDAMHAPNTTDSLVLADQFAAAMHVDRERLDLLKVHE